MAKQIHHIDFDQLEDFAHIGVRRAVIFMGLGLNAAHRKDFLDYELSKIPSDKGKQRIKVEFFPNALPADRVDYFKTEFARWVQDCCLCDLLEHHALFLDKIHLHVLVVCKSLGKHVENDDHEKVHNKFRHEGIPGKHKALRERFAIDPAHSATIDHLYEARNALTHDFGVVLPKRCDENGNFVLRWPKFNLVAIGDKTGKETPLVDMIGKQTSEDTTVALRIDQRETTYKEGERIEAGMEDLIEAFQFFASWAVPSTLMAFRKYVEASGIKIESTVGS